jgi:uncharacterized protein YndB with AHSA1/START domain
MTASIATTDRPVRKSIKVRATLQHTFDVFTRDFDSWWPRSHHIGKSPMQKAIIEGKTGGRCFTEQADGSECDWGSILAWEPPRRFVMAWQITAKWEFEPDLTKSSEVEVTFTPEPDGSTRVDLEHRYFHRMGADGESMRQGVDSEGGWGSLLATFAAQAEGKSTSAS